MSDDQCDPDTDLHVTREIDDAYLEDGLFDPETFVIEIGNERWSGPWREDYEMTTAILEYFGHSFRRESVNLLIGRRLPVVLNQTGDEWVRLDGEKIVESNGSDTRD